MSAPLPTVVDVLTHVRREFLMQFREAMESLQQPLEDRIACGAAVGGLRVAGTTLKGDTQLRTELNLGKLRAGDRVWAHDGVDQVDITEIPGFFACHQILEVSSDGLAFTVKGTKLDRATTWTFDGIPPSWRPISSTMTRIAGVLESSSPLGDKLRRWLGGGVKRPQRVTAARLADLTATQNLALAHALVDELTVIQGPPGTGKTHLLAAIIQALVSDGKRVLVSCFSHAAVDNVLAAVAKRDAGVRRTRLGGTKPASRDGTMYEDKWKDPVGPGVWGMTAFKAGPCWTKIIDQAIHEPKPLNGHWPELAELAEATTAAWDAAHLPECDVHFDVVVIDEASQMAIPQALLALCHGRRCILLGDHRQLPPVAQVTPVFAPSLFDQAIAAHGEHAIMLDRTFRMNDRICASPSRLFYGGGLLPSIEAGPRRLVLPVQQPLPAEPWLRRAIDPEYPVLFLRVDHDTGAEESPEEAAVVARAAIALLQRGIAVDKGIAVVCAHRRQNARVRAALAAEAQRCGIAGVADRVLCDTVERIQGQERDAIIVSLTGSDPDHLARQWSFSHCPRRFNVAITRPLTKLLVVGSPAFFHFTPGEVNPARIAGVAALKRWCLDRMDEGSVCDIPSLNAAATT